MVGKAAGYVYKGERSDSALENHPSGFFGATRWEAAIAKGTAETRVTGWVKEKRRGEEFEV